MATHSRIDAMIDDYPNLDTAALAAFLLEVLDKEDLQKAVRRYVADYRRSRVRDIENGLCPWIVLDPDEEATDDQTRNDSQHSPVPVDLLADRIELLGRSVYVPGEGSLRWGELTVDHHRARIAMQEKEKRGLERSIALHEQAIAEIEAVPGAECLFDCRRRKAA